MPYGNDLRIFLVLEFMEKGTLTSYSEQPPYLTHTNRMSDWMVYDIGFAFASALSYLHNQFHDHVAIIHRYLKPDNIAFTRTGVLKLIDFGLCTCIRKKES